MLLLLCIAFVLSGAAGLVYESIWTRYLGLFVGHSAYAQVLVLVIFLGGMSAGAFLVGRRAERVKRPLLWYAMVELAVGIIGLFFHDIFVWATQGSYNTLFPALGPGVMHSLAKWAIASLLILPQSVLLGATFPLMTAGALRFRRAQAGRTISLLYFANSLGAAVGVLFAGFVLIEFAGLPGTLLIAAMLNIIVAGVVFLAQRRDAAAEVVDVEEVHASRDTDEVPYFDLLLLITFGTAVSSFMYEIGWIRMLSLVLGSATHSFELMLSAFILGLACGAFAIRSRTGESATSLTTLAYVQLAMGTLAIATLPIYVQSFQWMADFMAAFSKTPSGYRAFSVARYVICVVVMVPATFCAGMTLPIITRMLLKGARGERAIGLVYAVNTLGSIVGVALAALVLLPLMGLKNLLVLGGLIDIALGVMLLVKQHRVNTWWADRRRWAPAMLAISLVVLIGMNADFNPHVLTSGVFRYGYAKPPKTPDVVFYADGRTATVSVRKILVSHGLSLATNGKPDASLGPEWFVPPGKPGPFTHDASTQTLLPLIVLAHVPQAKVAAVIGQGSGMSSHTLLLDQRLTRLVTIEIEPEIIRASTKFYPANRRVFDDPRSSFALDDARSYFASQREQFDLILSEPSTPWVAGVSGLFTTEFYAHVKRFLTPNGVFGQWLHLSEINDALVLSVIRAVGENFPAYTIYAVGNRDIIIMASNQPTLPAPDWSVLRMPRVAEALKRIYPLTPPMMDALHMVDSKTLKPLLAGGAPNSDFYPTLDLGGERARYTNEGANGFVGLVSDRFAIAPILENRREAVDGERYTAISFVPKLEAMDLAARWRDGVWDGALPAALGAAERAVTIDRLMADNVAPVDWHVWVGAVRESEETRSGGSSGVADSAYYRMLDHYMDAQHAPPLARESIAFLHGMAVWDFAQASQAATPLLQAAFDGDAWLPIDELREGAALARIKLGDGKGANTALAMLATQATHDPLDVRLQLLKAWARALLVEGQPPAGVGTAR